MNDKAGVTRRGVLAGGAALGVGAMATGLAGQMAMAQDRLFIPIPTRASTSISSSSRKRR